MDGMSHFKVSGVTNALFIEPGMFHLSYSDFRTIERLVISLKMPNKKS